MRDVALWWFDGEQFIICGNGYTHLNVREHGVAILLVYLKLTTQTRTMNLYQDFIEKWTNHYLRHYFQ